MRWFQLNLHFISGNPCRERQPETFKVVCHRRLPTVFGGGASWVVEGESGGANSSQRALHMQCRSTRWHCYLLDNSNRTTYTSRFYYIAITSSMQIYSRYSVSFPGELRFFCRCCLLFLLLVNSRILVYEMAETRFVVFLFGIFHKGVKERKRKK